jgi:hypothetical protein
MSYFQYKPPTVDHLREKNPTLPFDFASYAIGKRFIVDSHITTIVRLSNLSDYAGIQTKDLCPFDHDMMENQRSEIFLRLCLNIRPRGKFINSMYTEHISTFSHDCWGCRSTTRSLISFDNLTAIIFVQRVTMMMMNVKCFSLQLQKIYTSCGSPCTSVWISKIFSAIVQPSLCYN